MVDVMIFGDGEQFGNNDSEVYDSNQKDGADPSSYISIPKDTVLTRLFKELEELAHNSIAPEASDILFKAKKAFNHMRKSRLDSAPHRALITEVFSMKNNAT